MLLGNYVDEKLSTEVYSVIDNIIELVLPYILIYIFILDHIQQINLSVLCYVSF